MKRARLFQSASLLFVVAASACDAGERPPPVAMAAAEPAPPRPATPQLAATFKPLPASVRDMRRFTKKSRALIVTELQGMEALFAATPGGSPDRPALMRRLAEGYGELEHAAEADPASAPVASHEAQRAGTIARAARQAAMKYYTHLARDHAQWCAAPDPVKPSGCADESLYYLALAYEQNGQLDDARKVYLELIQIWPQSRFVPLAYLAFGELFFAEAQGEPMKLRLAGLSYAEVVKYPPPGNPAYGYGEYRLGQVLARQGDDAEALTQAQRAAAYAESSGDAALGALVGETLRDLQQRRGQSPAPALPAPAAPAPAASARSACSAKCGGSVSPELAASLRATAERSQTCYNHALRSSDVSGSLVIHVQVEEGGDVCLVEIKSSGTQFDTMEPCVRALFEGVRFAPPTGGCVGVNIPIVFSISLQGGPDAGI